MQQPTIRKATLNDLETLRRFEQSVIDAERPFDPTLKREHTNYYVGCNAPSCTNNSPESVTSTN